MNREKRGCIKIVDLPWGRSRSLMQTLCHRKFFLTSYGTAAGYEERGSVPNGCDFPGMGFFFTAFREKKN